MRLPTLASLAIALTMLTSEALAGKHSRPPSVWEIHRQSMDEWMKWPKNETRTLELDSLPSCIHRCITEASTTLDIHGRKEDARTVNRRVFCDPRLDLVNKWFIGTIGPCTLESCRHEHALEALKDHYMGWLKRLCTRPEPPPPSKPGPKMVDSLVDHVDAPAEDVPVNTTSDA